MSFYFCENCRCLSKFKLEKQNVMICLPVNKNDPKAEYKCQRCSQSTFRKNLGGLLYGIAIDKSLESSFKRKNRLSIQSKCIQVLEKLDETKKTKIEEEFKCSICLKLIDMSANLQCLKCKHLFCFYCLIKCLKSKSYCPFCYSLVTIDSLNTNTNLISTFNLMAKPNKNIDFCRLHDQICELYCKDCRCLICSKCSLSHIHIEHNHVSRKVEEEETKDQCKNQCKPINLVKLFLDDHTEIRSKNKEFINKIDNKSFDNHHKIYNEFYNNHTSEFDRANPLYNDQFSQNISTRKQIHNKINKISENKKIDNLNDVVMIIRNLSKIQKDTIKITEKCKQLKIDQEVDFIEPPIQQLFEIDLQKFRDNQTISMKIEVENLKVSELFLKKINSKTWNVYVKPEEISGLECYVSAKILNKPFFFNVPKNEILRLKQNGELSIVDSIVFHDYEVNINDKVDIELNYWKITDQLNSYIKKCEYSIKNNL